MKRISLNIPAQADQLDVVRLCLYGVANKLGFTYEEIEDMKVAVGEACNNAILHAPQDNPEENAPSDIGIVFEWDKSRLTIRVKDNGTGFISESALQQAVPLTGDHPGELRESGLGLYLMQALMDSVEIETGEGTEVILTKHLHL